MAETPSVDEKIITQKAAKQAVAFAFSPQQTPLKDELQARIAIVQETKGWQTELLRKIPQVAAVAARQGINGGTEAQQKLLAQLSQAQIPDLVLMRLERMIAQATADLFYPWQIIRALDPKAIPVQVLGLKSGQPIRQEMLTRSTGFQGGENVYFQDISSQTTASFPDVQGNQQQVVIGGQAFNKEAVKRVLEGNGRYRPMFDQDPQGKVTVVTPFFTGKSAVPFLFRLNLEQYLALRKKLGLPEERLSPGISSLGEIFGEQSFQVQSSIPAQTPLTPQMLRPTDRHILGQGTEQMSVNLLDPRTGQTREAQIDVSQKFIEAWGRLTFERQQQGQKEPEIFVPSHPLKVFPSQDAAGFIELLGKKVKLSDLIQVISGVHAHSRFNRFSIEHRNPIVNVSYKLYYIPLETTDGDVLLLPFSLEDYGKLKDRYTLPPLEKRPIPGKRIIAPFSSTSETITISQIPTDFESATGTGSIQILGADGQVERKYVAALATTRGIVRETNEDMAAVYSFQLPNGQTGICTAVYDGMGGHEAGDEASKIAAEAGLKFLSSLRSQGPEWQEVLNFQKSLEEKQRQLGSTQYSEEDLLGIAIAYQMVQVENRAVSQWTQSQGKDAGTTRTGALIIGNKAYIANVGDSRTIVFDQKGEVKKASRDHSLVASLVESGQIQPEGILTHPQKNYIYRSLGNKGDCPLEIEGLDSGIPAIMVADFQPSDLLLCSCDGVWEGLGEATPGQKLSKLIQAGQNKSLETLETLAREIIVDATPESGDNDTLLLFRWTK